MNIVQAHEQFLATKLAARQYAYPLALQNCGIELYDPYSLQDTLYLQRPFRNARMISLRSKSTRSLSRSFLESARLTKRHRVVAAGETDENRRPRKHSHTPQSALRAGLNEVPRSSRKAVFTKSQC